MTTNTDFAKYLSKFLSSYLPYDRNMSPNTVASYRDTFVLFINYMRDVERIQAEQLSLKNITKQTVLNFLSWIVSDRKCSISTRNNRLASIHSFIQYLQYEDIKNLEEWQKILSIKVLRAETKKLTYLTTEGVRALLAQPDMNTHSGRRDLAILALMYDTAARVQEIIDLTPESVRIEHTPYTIRLVGKGRKSRIVPLMQEQVDILRSYMKENRLLESNRNKHPLFYNGRGEKLTRSGVAYILGKYVREAHLSMQDIIPKEISCHSLRHSKAMHLLQAGVNIVYIRDFLGHVSVQTTEIYARADSKQKQEALEKAYVDLVPKSANKREWEYNQDILTWLKGFQKCQ
jgi:site-specific recombinase XerD